MRLALSHICRIIIADVFSLSLSAYSTEGREGLTAKYPLPHITNEQALTVVVQGRTVVLQCHTTCDCPQKDDIKVSWLDNGHKVSMDSRTQVSKAGELSIRNVTNSSVGNRVFKCVASIGNWSVIGVERRIKVIGECPFAYEDERLFE